MPTNKEIEKQQRNKKIIADYQHALSKAPVNKTKFAEEHGTSLRTLNRILDEAGLKNAKFLGEIPKKASKPVKTAKVVEAALDPVPEELTKAPPELNTPETQDATDSTEPNEAPEEEGETVSETKISGTIFEVETPITDVSNEILSWTVDKTRFISVLLSDGNTLSVEKDHENYTEIIHNLDIGEHKDALSLMSVVHKIANLEFGNFVVSTTGITFNGNLINNAIVDDLLVMFERKEPMEHLLKFFENLMMTPSEHIYTHLWKLIKHAGVTITPEGNVECFKRVNSDFTDCFTSKILNRVGDTVVMRRSEVDDNPYQTCSAGLHVCALKYLDRSGYGGSNKGNQIVKVVVRPQDFVSIPSDYQFTKARTCRYKVVSVYKG